MSRQDGTGVNGSRYCARVQRDNGETSTDSIYLGYSMETGDSIKFRGVKITLSFYARKGANFSGASDQLSTRVFSGTGTDEQILLGFTDGDPIIFTNAVLTTSWQKFTFTTSAVIAASVTQLGVILNYAGVGTAGAADYFEITQVQLCAGDVALPFQPKSYEDELRACQRYYEIADQTNQWRSPAATTQTFSFTHSYKVTKRGATPTITINAVGSGTAGNVRKSGAADIAVSAAGNATGFIWYFQAATALALDDYLQWTWKSDAEL